MNFPIIFLIASFLFTLLEKLGIWFRGLLKWKSFERNKILNTNLNYFSEQFYWGIILTTLKNKPRMAYEPCG